MNLNKFLSRHASELASIASILGAVVGALPIDRQDKRRLLDTVDTLRAGAANIETSLAREMSAVGKAVKSVPALRTATVPGQRKTPPTRKAPAGKRLKKPAEEKAPDGAGSNS